jgi:sulfide:quinone oxidoreductase
MIVRSALTHNFAVAGQVGPRELRDIAAHYRMLINNRPDGEEPGQPSSAELEAAARKLGLGYAYIPISGEIDDSDIAALAKALSGNRGPALAFCRTGNRSARLWALSQAGKHSAAWIIAAAADAGYDLRSLEPRLVHATPAK